MYLKKTYCIPDSGNNNPLMEEENVVFSQYLKRLLTNNKIHGNFLKNIKFNNANWKFLKTDC